MQGAAAPGCLHSSVRRGNAFRWRDASENDFGSGPITSTDVITVNHRLYRDRHTGRYIAAEPGEHGVAPARPHVLTMVNRLFDTPPPLIGKLTTRFTAQRRPPSLASSTKSADASVGYDRRQWPHFADDFARCERLVRSARSLLFAGAQREFETGCWRQLLLDGLVTPTSTLQRDAATAVGWTASWL